MRQKTEKERINIHGCKLTCCSMDDKHVHVGKKRRDA